jgi:hypothetical protein
VEVVIVWLMLLAVGAIVDLCLFAAFVVHLAWNPTRGGRLALTPLCLAAIGGHAWMWTYDFARVFWLGGALVLLALLALIWLLRGRNR